MSDNAMMSSMARDVGTEGRRGRGGWGGESPRCRKSTFTGCEKEEEVVDRGRSTRPTNRVASFNLSRFLIVRSVHRGRISGYVSNLETTWTSRQA